MTTPFSIVDRVKQYTSTTGAGTVTLNGVAYGVFQKWSDGGAVSGTQYPYLIEEGSDSEWGLGTAVNTGGTWTISRDTVYGSIIAGVSGTTKMTLAGNATIACSENRFSPPITRYDDLILSESSLTHYWPMDEASGASTLTDRKGSTNLTITDTNSPPNIICGVKGTVGDGKTAVYFNGLVSSKTNGIVNIPNGVFPASGDYSFEIILQWDGTYRAVIGVPFCMDTNGTGTDFTFYIRSDDLNRLWWSVNGGVDNWKPGVMTRIGRGTHLVFTMNSGSTTTSVYANGQLIGTIAAIPRQAAAGGMGTYLPTRDGGTYAYAGKISKFSIYNSVLSAATVAAHADAAGLS